jgi:hypothetical protein
VNPSLESIVRQQRISTDCLMSHPPTQQCRLMSKDPQAPSYPIFFVAPPLSNATEEGARPERLELPTF